MLHKEFWGLCFLAFVVWVFISPNPSKRIDRVCAPIEVVGNATTSLTSLVLPQHQVRMDRWFKKFDYGCEFLTWRMVYQDEYNEYLRNKEMADTAKLKAMTQLPSEAEKAPESKPEQKPSEKQTSAPAAQDAPPPPPVDFSKAE